MPGRFYVVNPAFVPGPSLPSPGQLAFIDPPRAQLTFDEKMRGVGSFATAMRPIIRVGEVPMRSRRPAQHAVVTPTAVIVDTSGIPIPSTGGVTIMAARTPRRRWQGPSLPRRRRARWGRPSTSGSKRVGWVDPSGNLITGHAWRDYYKPRRKSRKASATRAKRGGSRRKGRSAAPWMKGLRAARRALAAKGKGVRRTSKAKKRSKGRKSGARPWLKGLRKAWAAARRKKGGSKRRRGYSIRAYSPSYSRRARRRAHHRSKRHLRAFKNIRRGQRIAGFVRVMNPRTGEISYMPKALVANPRRRRRSRRRRNGRRVSNPGNFLNAAKGTIKGILMPTLAATAGGAAAGVLDTKLGSKPLISAIAKVALGVAGTAILRRRPQAAYAFFGSTVGTIGYSIGMRIGGGLVAGTKSAILGGLADLASGDPEMAAVLAGVGVGDIGDLVSMSQTADDPAAMGDLVSEVAGLSGYEGEVADVED